MQQRLSIDTIKTSNAVGVFINYVDIFINYRAVYKNVIGVLYLYYSKSKFPMQGEQVFVPRWVSFILSLHDNQDFCVILPP